MGRIFDFPNPVDEVSARLVATGVVVMVSAPISGRIARVMGPRTLLIIGGIGQVIAYTFIAFSDAHIWQIFVTSIIMGIGIGFGFAGMPMVIGASNGLNALFRSLGTSISAAIIAVILAASAFDFNGLPVPSLDGFKFTYVLAAIVAFVGLILSLMIPRRSAPLEEVHPALPD